MYWLKIINNKNPLIYKLYRMLRKSANTIPKSKTWEMYVKSLLHELFCLSLDSEDELFLSPQSINPKFRDVHILNVFTKILKFSSL